MTDNENTENVVSEETAKVETGAVEPEKESDAAESKQAAVSEEDAAKEDRVKRSPFEIQFSRRNPTIPIDEVNRALAFVAEDMPIPTIFREKRSEIPNLKESDVYLAIDEKEQADQVDRHKEHLIREIEAQGKLTPELKAKIVSTNNQNALDDIYLPFKLKGRTIATAAKEAGLAPLADWTWEQGHAESPDTTPFEEKAKEFVKADTSYSDIESVKSGVQNIIAERIAETAELRSLVRQSIMRKSKLKCGKGPKAKDRSKYQRFFDYKEPIGSLKKASGAQRYLTIRKGAAANELVLAFDRSDEGIITEKFEKFACSNDSSPQRELLAKAARLALNSQVYTAIEHEAHKMLKDFSERSILGYLTEGLRKRLLSPPFGGKTVIGIDPGLEKKPSSVALLSDKGDMVAHSNFPINNDEDWEKFRTELAQSLEKVNVEAIAVAHGPKGKAVRREIQKVLAEKNINSPVVMVYEQATTIYSTSSVAKEELPELDPSVRRAIFVGRFLQDPLQEMVKVDPKFLATGAFQYDINANRLGKALHRTIQSAVCAVGVNINTASRSLLAYLPGFDHAIAKAVVKYRDAKGAFAKLEDTLAVPEFNITALNQAKPFLSVDDADSNVRGEFKPYEYQSEFTDLAAVEVDKEVNGVITNITNFGVFIDVGLDQDGLVHISEFTDSAELYGSLAIGDQVKAWISAVEKNKGQLSLSFRSPEERKKRARPRRPAGKGGAPRKPRGPRRAPGEAAPDGEKREFRGRRGGGPRRGKGADGENKSAEGGPDKEGRNKDGKGRGRNKDAPAKKRPPQRDPKTGAIMKMDDSVYVSEKRNKGKGNRSKFKTKADVTTFNPFANLDKLVKNNSNSGNGDSPQN